MLKIVLAPLFVSVQIMSSVVVFQAKVVLQAAKGIRNSSWRHMAFREKRSAVRVNLLNFKRLNSLQGCWKNWERKKKNFKNMAAISGIVISCTHTRYLHVEKVYFYIRLLFKDSY